MPVVVWLPDDPGALNQALNQGQPVVQLARAAKISKRFHELAKQLNGQT